MKIFVALPMGSMNINEFVRAWEDSKAEAKKLCPGGAVCDSYCEDFQTDSAIHLAKNMMTIATADAIYFGDGWKKCPACKAEHTYAETIGIKILKD